MAECIRAWFRDDSEENLQELHIANPGEMLTAEQVYHAAGVKYRKIENPSDQEIQKKLAEGYFRADFHDMCPEALGDKYEKCLREGYAEHFHEDNEIRMVVAGSGFFEVRSYDDRWVRVHVQTGDLLDLPPGIYHRFTFDHNRYVKFFRLFLESPVHMSFYRSPEADAHPARHKFFSTRQQ